MGDNNTAVLMFSGGRDSTLAAVRLAPRYRDLVLVTVVAEHLFGLGRVVERLAEIAPLVPNFRWLAVRQPLLENVRPLRESRTCLPCQLAYAFTAAVAADRYDASTVAFGYAQYQSAWPEQTPRATARLRETLDAVGLNLELPVYDLLTKQDAVSALRAHSLSTDALEQKCLRQVNNVVLPDDELLRHVDDWADGLREALSTRADYRLDVLRDESFHGRARALPPHALQ